MSYRIKTYTKNQARKLGVIVKNSTNKKKKIDVFKKQKDKNGKMILKKIASVGAIGYNDYPTFIQTKGKAYADKRRKLYKIRHNKYRNIKGTNSYWADKLLW